MATLIIFLILSIPVIYISRKYIVKPKTHGFYRFLAWECILWLFASNYKYWIIAVLSIHQIISWLFLFISIYPVVAGTVLLKKKGKQKESQREENLYNFENTSALVDTGIYRYIRHPLYLSLILLTWGIYFKNMGIVLLFVSILSTLFLYITARFDEKECIAYFGEKYLNYINRSKMFIPFIF